MRIPAVLGLLCFLASGLLASAQVSIQAQMNHDRRDFLLYERVDIIVSITNTSGSDLVLDNEEGQPWLSFLISKHDRVPVRPERNAKFKALTLKAGQTQRLRVDLTPLFAFREEGGYTVQAVVDLPGAGNLVSDEVPFTVLHGRQVWSQQRPVDGAQRTYSLIRFSPKPDETELYLRVEDPSVNVVYANVGLGPVEAYIDPQVYFDPQGNIHVMQLISMSTYLYSRADAQGKVMHQGIFKSFQQVAPELRKMEDGSVYVAGGLEETPQTARETLSSGQRSSHAPDQQTPGPASAPATGTISSAPTGAGETLSGATPPTPTLSARASAR